MVSLVKNFGKQLFNWIDYLVSPPFCAYCKNFLSKRNVFCVNCSNLIMPLTSQILEIGKNNFVKIFSVGAYKYPLKSLILAKLRKDISAAKQLGFLCAQVYSNLNLQAAHKEDQEFDYIVPVPLHWFRQMLRGYNQAKIMAEEISLQKSIPVFDCLERIINTEYQSSLKKEDKHKNVKQAFIINNKNGEALAGKSIILVDDLYTSGATVKEIIKILNPYKLKKIIVLVGARAINL